MMNYKKSQFNLIFKVVAFVLLQAFLVMDIAWAAGGELFAANQETAVNNLAPELQLDAQVLKGVFLDSIDNPQRTTELTEARNDRQIPDQKSRIGLSSIITGARNLVLASMFFFIIAFSVAAPAATQASEKQAQAPPPITLEQKQFKKSLIEVSKKSNYPQVNDAGDLATIRVNLRRQGDENLVFTHGKARERVEEVNKIIDKMWLSSFVKGELDDYITKRGDSAEAIAIGKGLFFLQIADPDTYEVLKRNDVPILMGDIYNYNGYTRGSRFFGILGDPFMVVNSKFINNPFNLAMVFSHEGYHVEFDSPRDVLESISHYNLFSLLEEVFSGIPPNEQAAFTQQKEFVEFIEIIPIKGNYFYDEMKLSYAYRGNKMQNLFLDGVGTVMYNIVPLGAGALIVFGLVRRRQNRSSRGRYNRSGGSVLSGQNVSKRRGRSNRFRSIILLPLLGAFQSIDFFNPEASLAGGFGQLALDGSSIGLTVGATLIGVSVIGSIAWMILRRGQGGLESDKESSVEPEESLENPDAGFEYRKYGDDKWVEILKEHGLGKLNIAHILRNKRAVEYFKEKENLDELESEILKVSFWMHDLTKDNDMLQYKLRYMPEEAKLAQTMQSLYLNNLDDPKQAEQFLKENGYQEDIIEEAKRVLNGNLKLAGTLRLLIHHLESAKRAREILPELGYGENFVHQVESIIIRHMGPIMGKNRAGFMEFTRTMNLDAIENGLTNSDISPERKEQLVDYVDHLKRPFPDPITRLELIGRDIDLLDLVGDGIEKVVSFRQIMPDFFIDGKPEDISASFDSALQTAQDVKLNIGSATAEGLIDSMLERLEKFKTYMNENDMWNLIANADKQTRLKMFTQQYNDFIQSNLSEYDHALGGNRNLTPESLMNILRERGEEQAAQRLKRYVNDPMLEQAWTFALDFVTSSKDRRSKIKQHNEFHWNGLLIVFDALADHLPLVGNIDQAKRLVRLAIYMHDLGYFDESGENGLLQENHEQKSKEIARKFMEEFGEEFSALEIEVVMYLIDKTQVTGKLFDPFMNEVADDNRALRLLDDFREGRQWQDELGRTLDADFIKQYLDKNFPNARIWKDADSALVINAIWGGKAMAYGDVAGLDASADYLDENGDEISIFPEQIPVMSREFRIDKLELETMGRIEDAKKNPATRTYIEQMRENRTKFVSFIRNARLDYIMNHPDFNERLSLRPYLEDEHQAWENKGQVERSILSRQKKAGERIAEISEALGVLLSGHDGTGNRITLDMAKGEEDIHAVVVIRDFIKRGAAMGLYDADFVKEMNEEIFGPDGLIDRGLDRFIKWSIRKDAPVEIDTLLDNVFADNGYSQMLSPDELNKIKSSAKQVEVDANITDLKKRENRIVLKEGETDNRGVFIILSGKMEVSFDQALGYSNSANDLKEGDIFGEIAILGEVPRTASVSIPEDVMDGELVLVEIPRAELLSIYNSNEKFRAHIDGLARERVTNGITNNGVSKKYILENMEVSSEWGEMQQRKFNDNLVEFSI